MFLQKALFSFCPTGIVLLVSAVVSEIELLIEKVTSDLSKDHTKNVCLP